MASVDVRLAWCVPVKVEQLGAHPDAYVRLLPILNTIRLCNRFGQGSRSFIRRLPTELVTHVEQYLLQEEQEVQLSHWSKHLRCWEGLCQPADHYSMEGLKKLRGFHYFDDDLEDCGLRLASDQEAFNADQLDHLSHLLENGGYLPDDLARWWHLHEEMKEQWEEMVRPIVPNHPSIFLRHKDLVLKHFGVQTWVGHCQLSKPKPGQSRENKVFSSTLAYLMVPTACTGIHHDITRRASEPRLGYAATPGPQYVDSESSFASPLVPPAQLTDSELARFARGVMKLQLRIEDKNGSEKDVKPELRLLVKSSIASD